MIIEDCFLRTVKYDKHFHRVTKVAFLKVLSVLLVTQRLANAGRKPKNTQFAWDRATTTTTPKGPTTTEDIVIYEQGQNKVELDIPDELFGSGFTLLTNVSQTAGELITNTALRTQRLLESMRPLLRAIFGAKGIVIEATTDKPIFSDPNSSSSS